VVVVAVVAALLGASVPAAAAGPIAVVDIIRLIKAHPKYAELEAAPQASGKAADDAAKAEHAALERLRGQIEMMNENDPDRRQREREFLARTNSAKFEFDWKRQEAQRAWMRGLEVAYSEVQRLVTAYARSQSIQLVLVKNDRELNAGDFNDWALKVQLRSVVYADPSMDITDAVLRTIPAKGALPAGPSATGPAAPTGAPPVAPPVPPAQPPRPGVPPPPPPVTTPQPPR
jgi:Skp family chaperone for outer membrane proteins